MKLFHFYRHEDASGVSGTGPVVEGVQFTNGWCALRWLSSTSSMCFYGSIEEVKAVHGHGGKTEIIIHDFQAPQTRRPPKADFSFEILMQIIEEASRITTLVQEPDLVHGEVHLSITKLRGMLDDLEHGLGLRMGEPGGGTDKPGLSRTG